MAFSRNISIFIFSLLLTSCVRSAQSNSDLESFIIIDLGKASLLLNSDVESIDFDGYLEGTKVHIETSECHGLSIDIKYRVVDFISNYEVDKYYRVSDSIFRINEKEYVAFVSIRGDEEVASVYHFILEGEIAECKEQWLTRTIYFEYQDGIVSGK